MLTEPPIPTVAMSVCPRHALVGVHHERGRRVVDVAEPTLFPIRVATGGERIRSGVKETVVGTILTDHEVGWTVVVLIAVHVMHMAMGLQHPPQCVLGNQDVLGDVTTLVCSRVVRRVDATVPPDPYGQPSARTVVPADKAQHVSLPNAPLGPAPVGERCPPSASASAQSHWNLHRSPP